jgi:membrane protein DedA with SNARE-associated domain
LFATVTDWILHLHGSLALAIVFAVPALEASAFVGFLFPGEIAVLLGGVLASQDRVSLAGVLAAATAGAVLGDSVGYSVGRRWGRGMLHGSVGRVVNRRHLDRAEAYLADRGGKAVFLGRFTAALRVLIPGLAGMSRMRYVTFAMYNVAGAIVWATVTALTGYIAGTGWRRAEQLASRVGLALLAAVLIGLAVTWTLRRLGSRSAAVHAVLDRFATWPPAARLHRRFPTQAAWLARRLDPQPRRTSVRLILSFRTLRPGGGRPGDARNRAERRVPHPHAGLRRRRCRRYRSRRGSFPHLPRRPLADRRPRRIRPLGRLARRRPRPVPAPPPGHREGLPGLLGATSRRGDMPRGG